MTTIAFYYSIGSRYSYLASSQLARLEQDFGCRVDWRPINGSALRARSVYNPFEQARATGQYDWSYRERDATRWAALYGIPFLEPRGRVQFDPQQLALAAVAAKRLGVVEAMSHALFGAMFAEAAVTAIDRAECIRRAQACSIAAARFEQELDDPATAQELADITGEADRLGVFGVPTFVVDGELFWGNDRLVLLRQHLAARG
ncbi:MAG: DsbA family protein [Nevskia sp.]|nr:DsbA family protein [Nevskia sp.]